MELVSTSSIFYFMKLPIYILESADLCPIPDTNFLLELSADKIDKVTLTKSLQCIFLIPKVSEISADSILSAVHHVGFLGTALDKDEIDGVFLFNFHEISAVEILDIEIDDSYLAWAEARPLVLEPIEEELGDLMRSTYNTLLNKKNFLPPFLLKQLQTVNSLPKRMNILADFLLKQDADMRLRYVMTMNYPDKWNILINALRVYNRSLKNKNSAPPVAFQSLMSKTEKQEKPERVVSPLPDIDSSETELTIDQKIAQLTLPKNVIPTVNRELDKLKRVPSSSTEYSLVVDWLTWVHDLPWGKSTMTKIDLSTLEADLNKSHYGLNDVKQYVIEHFCMQEIVEDVRGTVLCFSGPPGTGKTSIAKQIAISSGRPLYRIALGGISDENELRGHRRTYVASRPGRISMGLKETKTMSPLFLLDEIDKLGHGNGDPTSALLELLDPEQNDHFVDRYFEFPLDLSKAMFICTANDIHRVHDALKDRMEIIEFRDYTKEEILTIITSYVIPKILKDYKIQSFPIAMSDEAIAFVAKNYKIRQAEKVLRQVYKSAAVQIFVYKKESVLIDINTLLNLTQKNKNTKDPMGFRS